MARAPVAQPAVVALQLWTLVLSICRVGVVSSCISARWGAGTLLRCIACHSAQGWQLATGAMMALDSQWQACCVLSEGHFRQPAACCTSKAPALEILDAGNRRPAACGGHQLRHAAPADVRALQEKRHERLHRPPGDMSCFELQTSLATVPMLAGLDTVCKPSPPSGCVSSLDQCQLLPSTSLSARSCG
jgi:hypothetical protein